MNVLNNFKAIPPLAFALSMSCISHAALELTWRDNATTEAAYEVERSADGTVFAAVQVLPPDAEVWIDDTVEVGTQYWYRVRAVNEYGYSDYSNVGTAIAMPQDQPPADPDGMGVTNPESAPVLEIITNADGSITIRSVSSE